jgi:hypothetical protein
VACRNLIVRQTGSAPPPCHTVTGESLVTPDPLVL